MKFPKSRILCTLVGLTAVLGAQPTLADDSEVFTSSMFTTGVGARPNVLFIIDTSGSMDSVVTVYDRTQTYTGACDAGYVYWATANSSVPPNCATTTLKFTLDANRCRTSYTGMTTNGWWNGRVQQLNVDGTAWADLAAAVPDRKVECEGDRGNHGDTIASSPDGGSNTYARNGSGTNRWGDNLSNNQVNWGGKPRASFYSANYINWYFGGGRRRARDAHGYREGRRHRHDQHPARGESRSHALQQQRKRRVRIPGPGRHGRVPGRPADRRHPPGNGGDGREHDGPRASRRCRKLSSRRISTCRAAGSPTA